MTRRPVAVLTAALLLALAIATALPAEENEQTKKVERSPAVDDDDFPSFEDDTTEKPKQTTSTVARIGKLLNTIIQIPINMFKAVNSLFANQSLSKLREEVRNLNISYPKSG